MENIIYYYDGICISHKIVKLSALVIGFFFMILIIIDISDNIVTYLDNDYGFEVNLNELKKMKKLKSIKNDLIDDEKLKKLLLKSIKNYTDDLNYKMNLSYFTKNLTKYKYKGKWTTKISFGELDKKEGVLKLYISSNPNKIDSNLRFEMVFLDGEFIDKWTYIRTFDFILSKDSSVSFDSNFFISSNIISNITNGVILENNLNKNTFTNIKFTWKICNNENQSSIDTIKGTITVSNTEIEFEVNIDDGKELNDSILIYSLIVTVLSILQLISSLWLNCKVSDSQNKYNSISIITVCQNMIWNAYGCFINFLFSNYNLYFGIPALLYFINFSIVEVKLLYSLWKNQNHREIFNYNYKKVIKFYLFFYISLFMSLFFVTKFFFRIEYILIAILFTWIPQIIHNYQKNNSLSLPLLNVILISLNKITIPIYFRGSAKNFLNLAYHPKLSLIFIVIIVVEIICMYFQNIYGPKFFIPKIFLCKSYNYYRMKEEILHIYPDSEYKECIICLLNIFDNPDKLNFRNDFNSSVNVLISNNNYYKNFFLDFHMIKEKHSKKPYMITQCNHIFHSYCLELWFLQKKECPTCRNKEIK